MKPINALLPLLSLFLVVSGAVHAAVHYVNVNNTTPVPPYTDWATAAATIQDAVDAAVARDTILVTNGVYESGGKLASGSSTTNRVAVDKPVTVTSVNGPEVTVIRGRQAFAGGKGVDAVRCAYLTNGSVLAGFTLTNGAAISSDYGGGVYCRSDAVLSNCVLTGNSAFNGGGSYYGTLNNCTVEGNSATSDGGGVYYSMLTNCTVRGNSGVYGGGSSFGSLTGCTVTNNSASYGGGAYYGKLTQCTVTSNSASVGGGGARFATLNNCTVTGNSAPNGGGSHYGTLNNCVVKGNRAITNGGGVCSGTLNNCTVTGNSASSGGGTHSGTVNNCIVYFNNASSGFNYSGGTLNYSCTTPIPGGTGNITNAPQLASVSHLGAGSPCIGMGITNYTSGVDIDGETWASPPSIGCDEYKTGAVTGPLSVAIRADSIRGMPGHLLNFVAEVSGRTSGTRWDFGDGTVVSNQPYASHAWLARGDYSVVLTAYNESNPGGVSAALTVHVVENEVLYVAVNSVNPQWPYTTWETAATNIQQAIDVAFPGALVLVSNGVYQTGGKLVSGTSTTNRVAVDKPITVASVNGPEVTVIQGRNSAGNAVRCAYVTNGAVLAGFTLTNGATTSFDNGGALYCQSVSVLVSNCVLTGNSASYGGGAYCGTLNNCALVGNSATYGGGADSSTLNNCALTGNSATCGGGADSSTLNNCTVTGNSADYGGGVDDCTLNNCIVYYNNARSGFNYHGSSMLTCCCAIPMPGGTGNITNAPQLASVSHLSASSPCIGKGTNFTIGVDTDGEAWGNPPSIGCDEYRAGAVTGTLSGCIRSDFTTIAPGYAVNFVAETRGRTTGTRWNFGDGTVVSNQPCISHAWTAPGDHAVVLTAYNESCPAGTNTTLMVHVIDWVHYVASDGANPLWPYATWETAATNIQQAVDAACSGALVLVSNGVYQTGGKLASGIDTTNRVAVDKAVTVSSVNGPSVTVIRGQKAAGGGNGVEAMRCVYLTNGAVLMGFTLTNGATTSFGDGGGVYCRGGAVVSNCILTGNSADGGGGAYSATLNHCVLTRNSADCLGGGASSGLLNNCVLTGNSAPDGGGSYSSILNNCTVTGNSATFSVGGAYASTLNNCIVYDNIAPRDANYSRSYWSIMCTLNDCCTTPLPTAGTGNITNAPLFSDQAAGNLRLQPNSPCINAGLNASAPGTTDLDGNPRIVGGTVDIGAYEYQTPASTLSYSWAQQFGLPTDGSADHTDPDGDGLNNWQEWKCQTDPTNNLSVLKMQPAVPTGTNVVVTWQSVAGVSYFVDRSTNLSGTPPFHPLATNLTGASSTTRFTDTNAPRSSPLFYRVGVGEQ